MSAKRRKTKAKYPIVYLIYTFIGNAVIFIMFCVITALFVSKGKMNEHTLKILITVIAFISGLLSYRFIGMRAGEKKSALLTAILNFGLIMLLGAFLKGETVICAVNGAASSIGMIIGSAFTKRINTRRT